MRLNSVTIISHVTNQRGRMVTFSPNFPEFFYFKKQKKHGERWEISNKHVAV